MLTFLNKCYLVKVSTKGRGGSKIPQILSSWFVHATSIYIGTGKKLSRKRAYLYCIHTHVQSILLLQQSYWRGVCFHLDEINARHTTRGINRAWEVLGKRFRLYLYRIRYT